MAWTDGNHRDNLAVIVKSESRAVHEAVNQRESRSDTLVFVRSRSRAAVAESARLFLMRIVALVLVLGLTAPAFATAVCEWRCAHASHHASHAAAAAGCHEQQSGDSTVSVESAVAAACHTESDLPAAVTAALEKAPLPATISTFTLFTLVAVAQPSFASRSNLSPPDRSSPASTPLRI